MTYFLNTIIQYKYSIQINLPSKQTTKIHKNHSWVIIKYFRIYCNLKRAFSYVDKTIWVNSSYLNNLRFAIHTQRLFILSSTAYKQDYYHLLLAVLFLSPTKLININVFFCLRQERCFESSASFSYKPPLIVEFYIGLCSSTSRFRYANHKNFL